MAAQKSKKSRSKRDSKRNSKVTFKLPSLTRDRESGELHVRHSITSTGYYMGRKILDKPVKSKVSNKTE